MLIGHKDQYSIALRVDEDARSPRDDDNFGTMVCFHRRYSLGDEHEYENVSQFLSSLLENMLGDAGETESCIEKIQGEINSDDFNSWGAYSRAVDDALLEFIHKEHVILPLYLYDHSMQSISTESFIGRAVHAEWDSGQVGWVYAAKEDVEKEFGGNGITPENREQAERLLKSEVEHYNAYLQGNCYGYELYMDGNMVDSCWGFIGEPDDVMKCIEDYLPEACKGITEAMREQPEKISVLAVLEESRAMIAATPRQNHDNNIEPDAR